MSFFTSFCIFFKQLCVVIWYISLSFFLLFHEFYRSDLLISILGDFILVLFFFIMRVRMSIAYVSLCMLECYWYELSTSIFSNLVVTTFEIIFYVIYWFTLSIFIGILFFTLYFTFMHILHIFCHWFDTFMFLYQFIKYFSSSSKIILTLSYLDFELSLSLVKFCILCYVLSEWNTIWKFLKVDLSIIFI